ncbi:MAG: hypothetical protein PHV18_14875 [Lachnospiraceae bacterium]|nr:hypothetical protein [Lachnospiraceae bacterium]
MAAGGNDGSLKFDTKINPDGFMDGISTLTKAVENLTKVMESLSGNIVKQFGGAGSAAESASKEVDTIGEAAQKSEAKVKSLREQMDAITIQHWDENMTDAENSEPTNIPISVPVSNAGVSYDSKAMAMAFGEAAAEIHNYAEAVSLFGMQAGSAMNMSVQGASTARVEIEQVDNAVERSGRSFGWLKTAISYAFESVGYTIGTLFKAIPITVKTVTSAFVSATNAVVRFGIALGTVAANGVKRVIVGLRGLIKPAEKAGKSILKLSSMFKLMLIRMAMRAAIQGIREGMQNLVQYSDSANQSMSNLVSGMTYLKNSFAAAFAPILSFVAPVLNTLINLLATAIGYINQFFAALGGGKTFVKAKKVNQDYAKSIGAAGGAAKQAGKDAKKALAPFDELNTIQEQGAGSGDGGGGSGGGIDPSEMFDTVAIDSALSDFANQVKEAFKNSDWKGLGTLFGNKVNELLDSVDWGGVGHKIGFALNGAIQTAYWFLDTVDFKNIGKRIGELLNGAIEEIDFKYLGRLVVKWFTILPDIIIGAVVSLDWGLVGKSIGDFFIGAFDEAAEWLQGYDWSYIGGMLWQKIKDLFTGIDWSGLASSLFTFLGAAIRSCVGLLGGFFGSIGADIKAWWDAEIQGQDWKETAGNLLNAIGEGFVNIGDWVWDHIVEPFCTALLGEDTWSDVKEAGNDIWNGFTEGIAEFSDDPGAWIKDHIVDPFVNGFKNLFGIHSPSTVMAEIGKFLMEGLKNGIENFIPNVVAKFGEIKSKISEKWDEVKTDASSKWSTIKGDLSSTWDGMKTTAGTAFEDIKKGITDAWQQVNQKTSEVWGNGGIAGIVSGAVNGIISSAETMANAVIKAINGLISGINKVSIDIPDTPFSSGFKIGFDIPSLNEVHLPRLATGTVVPPRAGEFAAILGDNNREAEVVSPVSTMEKAVMNALTKAGITGGGDIYLTAVLDGKVVYDEVVKRNRQETKRAGKNPMLAT